MDGKTNVCGGKSKSKIDFGAMTTVSVTNYLDFTNPSYMSIWCPHLLANTLGDSTNIKDSVYETDTIRYRPQNKSAYLGLCTLSERRNSSIQTYSVTITQSQAKTIVELFLKNHLGGFDISDGTYRISFWTAISDSLFHADQPVRTFSIDFTYALNWNSDYGEYRPSLTIISDEQTVLFHYTFEILLKDLEKLE